MLLQKLFKKTKPPIYFLYTKTKIKDYRNMADIDSDYSTNINSFFRNLQNEYHKEFEELYSEIYKFINGNVKNKTKRNAEIDERNQLAKVFGEKDCGDYTIYGYIMCDRRYDAFGRVIFSCIGVIVDKKDKSFDLQAFCTKIMQAKINKKTNNIFYLAKELPIKYKQDEIAIIKDECERLIKSREL